MTVVTLRHPSPFAATTKPGLLPTPIPEAKEPLEAKGVVCLEHCIVQGFLRTLFIPKTIKIKAEFVKAEMRNSFLQFNLEQVSPQPISRAVSCPDFLDLLEDQKRSTPPAPPPAKTNSSKADNITTYMIRNIPTRFTSITFVRLMEDYGFTNSFNFFYLPMDFRSGKNMGYAFINFVDPQLGQKFFNRFNQRRLPVTTSKKVLEISPSRRQGLAENIALFRTSDLLNSVSLPHYKPLIATDQTSGSLVPLTETNFPPLRK